MSKAGINMKQKDLHVLIKVKHVLIRINPVLKYMIGGLPLDRHWHLLLEHHDAKRNKIEINLFTMFVHNNSQLVQNKWSFELCTSVIHLKQND